MPDWFVDTNVLVYAYDRVEQEKRARSLEVLDVLVEQENGALSAQVLGEFYNACTRRMRAKLAPEEAARRVAAYSRSWVIYPINAATVVEATVAAGRLQLSYWDALIWATAKLNGVANILSEDFEHGRIIEAVRVLNPFERGFDWRSVIEG